MHILYSAVYIRKCNMYIIILCPWTESLCNELNNVTSFIKLFDVKRYSEMIGCKYGPESLACSGSEVWLQCVHYKLAILSTSSFLTLIMGIKEVYSTKNLQSVTSGLSKFWARENLIFQLKLILRAASGLSNDLPMSVYQGADITVGTAKWHKR